jgi:hypothetical protein
VFEVLLCALRRSEDEEGRGGELHEITGLTRHLFILCKNIFSDDLKVRFASGKVKGNQKKTYKTVNNMLCVRVVARIPSYVVHNFMRAHSRDVGGGWEGEVAREESQVTGSEAKHTQMFWTSTRQHHRRHDSPPHSNCHWVICLGDKLFTLATSLHGLGPFL